ncbi:MAG: NAD(P)/FAD-dependent oxidoreductase, partial [Candidatus Methylomirabilales bacterium]
TQFADRVTIVERSPKLKASRLLQDKVLAHMKMQVLTNRGIREFRAKDGGKLGTVAIEDLTTGVVSEHHPAAAFVFIGLDPNTQFLRGTVDLDPWGFVMTKGMLETNVPGVFAAGDVRAGSTKQLAAAVGEGAAAALGIRGYLESLATR